MAVKEQNLDQHPQIWEGDEAENAGTSVATKNKKTLIMLTLVGMGMLGFAFANVPLFYDVLRRAWFQPELGRGTRRRGRRSSVGPRD